MNDMTVAQLRALLRDYPDQYEVLMSLKGGKVATPQLEVVCYGRPTYKIVLFRPHKEKE